jgi:hypothetical protein
MSPIGCRKVLGNRHRGKSQSAFAFPPSAHSVTRNARFEVVQFRPYEELPSPSPQFEAALQNYPSQRSGPRDSVDLRRAKGPAVCLAQPNGLGHALKITRPNVLGHATPLTSEGPKARPFA